MKYILLLHLFLLLGVAEALPVYNPAAASLLSQGVKCEAPVEYCCWYDVFSFNLGFTGYYVRDHKMELTGAKSDEIRDFSKRTNAGYIAINTCNRFEIFSTLGATNLLTTIPARGLSVPLNEKVDVRTDTAFSWSVGARATIFQCGCFAFGVEGEYFNTNPNINSTTVASSVGEPNGLSYKYKEWQIGFGAAYRINISSDSTALIPYLAGRYGGTTVDSASAVFKDPASHTLIFSNMKQLRSWGYAVGITLVGCDKIQVTAEGSFLNETAFLINSTLRF